MPDAGNAGSVPTSRRYGTDDVRACYENQFHWAGAAERLGYDTMWLTEHHFQHEGYEVVPDILQFGLALALRIERLRFGRCSTSCPVASPAPGRGLRHGRPAHKRPHGVRRWPAHDAPGGRVDQRIMAIGSVDDVVDVIGVYRDELSLRHLIVFPDFPGLSREAVDEQLQMVATEVLPRLGA